jgi:hypothetical protein
MRYAPLTLAASALMLTGCFVASFFVPVSKSPADQAHELDKKCRGFSDPGSLSLLIPDNAVDSVAPAYSHVVDPPADHLRGAQIHVRPLPGVSKESLTRALECHEASVVLGNARSLENDPFTMPERWVDIDVDSDGDSFVVRTRVDAFPDAQKVLVRAKNYFAAVRGSVPSLSAAPVSALPAATSLAPPAAPAATSSASPAAASPAAASPTPASSAPAPPAAAPQAAASPRST